MTTPQSLTSPLTDHIRQHIATQGGWVGFDGFMQMALYAPGLGYYARGARQFGAMPQGLRGSDGEMAGAGSDFVTAPELTPLFGQALARQVAQALDATGTDEVWEFGAGSGALAQQLLEALGTRLRRYTIVDVSGALRARQQQRLQAFGEKVVWASELPEAMRCVILGNEVLDAMPVQLIARVGGQWYERGVVTQSGNEGEGAEHFFAWGDRPTHLSPPIDVPGLHDYLTEIHPQGESFVRTLANRLQAGAIFLLDYGFPEGEYYHPQRHMGTVMCHRLHQSDANPLTHVGEKDITAHVDFTGIALAAQDAGLEVLGYTSQAHFLINCGLAQAMQDAALPERVAAQKLLMEHEMGELFKVIGLTKGVAWDALGFSNGDRTARL